MPRIVEIVVLGMEAALHRGDRIEIRGFGSFKVHERAARLGRNPRTGEAVQVAAKKVVQFKPSKEINRALVPQA